MHVRSNVLKTRNLPRSSKKLDAINAKPYLFIVILFMIGITLLVYGYFLTGIAITLIFGYHLLFIRNAIVTEFYEEYVVFYMDKNCEECFLLFWNDILSWSYLKRKHDLDMIEVVLKNNQKVSFKCLSKKKILKYFTAHVAARQIGGEI